MLLQDSLNNGPEIYEPKDPVSRSLSSRIIWGTLIVATGIWIAIAPFTATRFKSGGIL